MAKGSGNLVGAWAFLIGVILAVVFGAMGNSNSTIVWILVVLGLIIGLLNVADKEVGPFLMAAAVLLIASEFGGNSLSVIPIVGNILAALQMLFVPATVIVAVKHVFSLAKN